MIQKDHKGILMCIYIRDDALFESVATFWVGPLFLVVRCFLDLVGSFDGGPVFRRKLLVPARLWDYGFVWVCEIGNICANISKYAEGRTPIEIITGKTPNISEYLDFEFYDWVMYQSNAGP
jgi:hypothetical protein